MYYILPISHVLLNYIYQILQDRNPKIIFDCSFFFIFKL